MEYTWKVRGLMTPTQKTSIGKRIDSVCSGIVDSVEDGENIIKMLKSLTSTTARKGVGCFISGDEPAFLDYNPDDNNWIQLKICVSMEYLTSLQVLLVLCSRDNKISKERVEICREQDLVDLIFKEYYKYICIEDELRNNGSLISFREIKKDMYRDIDNIIDTYYKSKEDKSKEDEEK